MQANGTKFQFDPNQELRRPIRKRRLTQPIEEFEADGVRMIFQNTPNTEAPREMNTYFPDMKARFIPKGELGFIFLCLYDAVVLGLTLERDRGEWSTVCERQFDANQRGVEGGDVRNGSNCEELARAHHFRVAPDNGQWCGREESACMDGRDQWSAGRFAGHAS
jgi:hypothetical protein